MNIFDLNNALKKDLILNERRNVIILGSTGSVGKTTFELCMANLNTFYVHTIVAGYNTDEAIRQANIAQPKYVVMANQSAAQIVQNAVQSKVLCSNEAKKYIFSCEYDIGVSAIPGIEGVEFTLETIKCSKILAFANKETIIYAGEILLAYAKKYHTCIIPIDSEHNAIFQCLTGIDRKNVDKLILTASGGPFLHTKDLTNITVREALNHPTWKMGKKISIDCATLFNKAIEVIEASYLFDCTLQDIEVVIHPESIIHGMVKLIDGAILMHSSPTSMKFPISYALNWPDMKKLDTSLDLTTMGKLTFLQPQYEQFPIFNLVLSASKNSTIKRIIMNCANDYAVQLFLTNQITFMQIYEIVKYAINNVEICEVCHNYDNEYIAWLHQVYYHVTQSILRDLSNKIIN